MTADLSIRILRPTLIPPANAHRQPLDCFLGDGVCHYEVSREWSRLCPLRLTLVDILFDVTGNRPMSGKPPSAQRIDKPILYL